MIQQIIKDINKELKNLTTLIIGSNSYEYRKISVETYKKYTKDNLIKAIQYRNMILKKQKDTLNKARYDYKCALHRLRTALMENYVMKAKSKYPRNFSFSSLKKFMSEQRRKKK